MSDNLFYKSALASSSKTQSEPIGLSDFKPQGKVDEIVVKQNNTIIELLISLSKRLAETTDKIDSLSLKVEKLQEDKALEALTSKINKISISAPVGHIEPVGPKRPLQSHTFHYNLFGTPDSKGKKVAETKTEATPSETK